MKMELIATAIGFSGMILVLLAFLMNQARKWSADSILYDATNAVGSLLLIAYAVLLKSYPFLILNAIWAAISARDIFIDIKNGNAANEKPKARIGHKVR
ncbi:hypothetical protein COV21_02650 [Candidatus Woesearchaeota archaeon CG10_big_fil_rev_8_21_14_0_10_45_5]|nr:MAG: hypothetical protein COV21_02650 [Candidatus Woesearchaeota archaeon CG10_big_fil_rev_8_21_14_0_10_45_5]PIU30048.1 MAG: hypothetical protein COT07_02815 [Candidatus Woesearchaeota archaeon CG07_land_8_20_14_0_80_44_23]